MFHHDDTHAPETARGRLAPNHRNGVTKVRRRKASITSNERCSAEGSN
jgi:hypothetical protein